MSSDSPSSSESSMDFVLDVSQPEGSRPIPINPCSKGVKLDVNCGKPPTVFTRATSKGFILNKHFESVQDDQIIKMFPPKQKHPGRESRSRSLNDLSDPLVFDVASSERTLEGPATTVPHNFSIKPDTKMKRVEDEADANHLDKSESGTVTGGLLEKILENTLLEKEGLKGLSAAAVFH
ncbi:unnamed protein product [Lactuca saligna]|uniref:Uncharacterized protein n=1 Tax=Lactuca saligna TaxID=75948 RepID=A0AA35YJC5_LACSI|nr:unnamed protein product [Lactuca saligna]